MSLLRSPWRMVVIALFLIGGVWSALTLRLETELLPLLPPALPSVRGLNEFQRQFGSEREVFLIADPALPAAERAMAFQKLRPALAAVLGVAQVLAPGEEIGPHFPELVGWTLSNLPPAQFAKVLGALQPEPVRARLAALPEALAGALDPEELGRLQLDPLGLLEAVSGGDTAAAQGAGGLAEMAPLLSDEAPPFLIVRTTDLLVDFHKSTALCNALKSVVAQTLPGERRILLTGRPAFTAEISQQMKGDMSMMMGLAAFLVCALFWAFYRTLRPLGWILFFQALALLGGAIVARLWFGSLNVISMGFASILLGVSMDYSILVYHHFASSHHEDAEVWQKLGHGIWFSAVTTAAAFLVLAFSSFPGLRQLSALVAAGLLASALFATWLLPVVLRARRPEAPPILDRTAHAAAAGLQRVQVGLLALAAVLALAGAWLLWQHPGDLYQGGMLQFQPSDSDAFRGQQWLSQSNAGERDAIFLVHAPTWAGVKAGAEALAQQVSRGRMSAWSRLLPAPDLQKANLLTWPAGTLARLRGDFEQAGVGEEWSGPTLRLAAALESAAAGDSSAFQAADSLVGQLSHRDATGITAMVRLPEAHSLTLPKDPLQIAEATVLPVSWVSLGEELTAFAKADLARLGGWMIAALALLCALAHRSLRLVLLNFVALVLALLFLALILKLTNTTLSPLSLLSVPLLIGLVIDYTLHILMALEHHDGDLRLTYEHLAAPVLLTGLSSCIGFGAPILTRQPALRNFGLVMDFGILAAVATCLIILPVLYRVTRWRRPAAGVPSPHPHP